MRGINMGAGKVMAAMSGGVDSSVAALLLIQSGYQVVGATLEILSDPGEDNPAGGRDGSVVEDARRVADQLGIPHYVLNDREAFEKKIIAYFCEEYLQGRTPNPCVRCNQLIKFGDLLRQAQSMGFDYLATGHYARIQYDRQRQRYLLYRGQDRSKDQSYFLYLLNQEQLAHSLFPLGGYSKADIRTIAGAMELTVAEKSESQEICFVTDDDYARLVEDRYPGSARPGPILNRQGEVLGQHRGLLHYTVGQRRGLRLAQGYPVYVLALDSRRNAVVVGRNEEVFANGCSVVQLNWIAVENLTQPLEVEAQIRYKAQPTRAMIRPRRDGSVQVEFGEAVRAVTPGQAIVFYEGDVVVGGGTIV
jgi:tRNA-specific 2-thiouridylase